jgi:hypothetical protein
MPTPRSFPYIPTVADEKKGGRRARSGVVAISAQCQPEISLLRVPVMTYALDAAWANLTRWVRDGVPAPRQARVSVESVGTPQARVVLDQYGNAVGGVRTPYLDVPTATYYTSTKGPGICGQPGAQRAVPVGKARVDLRLLARLRRKAVRIGGHAGAQSMADGIRRPEDQKRSPDASAGLSLKSVDLRIHEFNCPNAKIKSDNRKFVNCSILVLFLAATMNAQQVSPAVRSELAPSGTLRIGINFGNAVLATRAGGTQGGIAVDLGRELGRRVGVPITIVPRTTRPVRWPTGAKGAWDVAFLAADSRPRRGDRVHRRRMSRSTRRILVPAWLAHQDDRRRRSCRRAHRCLRKERRTISFSREASSRPRSSARQAWTRQ